MALESYKYFRPETTNLRAEYGQGLLSLDPNAIPPTFFNSDLIQNFGDSVEITPAGLTERHILKQLNLPNLSTRYLWVQGLDGSANTWIRVSDSLYPAISGFLTSNELATVQSTLPTGFTVNSVKTKITPHPIKQNIIVRGDSISAGLGTTSGSPDEVVWAQTVAAIDGTIIFDSTFTGTRQGETENYNYMNYSIGGSSWANIGAGGEKGYPHREDLAYPQRTSTLPLRANDIFIYWLGTNDLNYDPSTTGADIWTRAVNRLSTFRTDFPDTKLVLTSVIKRSESVTFNDRVNDFNTLLRANYLSAGADALIDFEANVPEFNTVTGNTGDTAVYTDGTHITTYGHSLGVPVAQPVILSLL